MMHIEHGLDTSSTTVLRTNRQTQAQAQAQTQAQAQAHSHYAVTLHHEESANASWPYLPTNQAHMTCRELTKVNKNNRDTQTSDCLKCQT